MCILKLSAVKNYPPTHYQCVTAIAITLKQNLKRVHNHVEKCMSHAVFLVKLSSMLLDKKNLPR